MPLPRHGQALGEGLKVNKTLEYLSLEHNSIGDAGVKVPGVGW